MNAAADPPADRAADGSDGPYPDEVDQMLTDDALIETIRGGIPLPRGAGSLARALAHWRRDVVGSAS